MKSQIKLSPSLICSVIALTLLIALVVFVFASNGTSEPTDAPSLAGCYATEFGTKPPSGVRNLRAKQVVIGDSGEAWLRFEADSNTFSQIISNRFKGSDRMSIELNIFQHVNRPPWWNPKLDVLHDFYINTQWRPGSNYSIAVIVYDPTNRDVYFHHGISF